MNINRMMLAMVSWVLALLLGVGQLAAQEAQRRSALTEKEARALVGAAGRDLRIFQLNANADGPTILQKLHLVFGDHAMVKVTFAYDEPSRSLVAAGKEAELDTVVAQVVKTLDVASASQAAANSQSLRPIRVAVFDFDVLKGVEMEPAALTDQVNTMLAGMDKVSIVNRDQIKKVADEHKMALSGLVDSASAAQLGKFLSANYVIVGRASKIGQTNYLVLKMIDVGTTVQTTVSAKAAAENGLEALIERLAGELGLRVRELQKPLITPDDETLAQIRAAAKAAGLVGKVIVVDVSETHVNRSLADPAAQMAIANRLKVVGVEVLVPKDPPAGWKQSLLETGRYGAKKVDFLLEGEGTSAYAAEMQGMISCRARVELRLIAVPGRGVTVTDKGVAARVDLVEALAAKAALEDAGANALDAVIHQSAKSR